MGIYEKHNADLLKAKALLGKLQLPAKDKADLAKAVDGVEQCFVKAMAWGKAQKKRNDVANELRKKYEDYLAKMPDQGASIKLVDTTNDMAKTATGTAEKLSAEATKKKDAASAKALDAIAGALLAIYRDTGSYVVFVGMADD